MRFYLVYKLICQKPDHFWSDQVAVLSIFLQMFIVLGMYNFAAQLDYLNKYVPFFSLCKFQGFFLIFCVIIVMTQSKRSESIPVGKRCRQNSIATIIFVSSVLSFSKIFTPKLNHCWSRKEYTANVCRELQGLCGEIGVRGFQIYGDCMYSNVRSVVEF